MPSPAEVAMAALQRVATESSQAGATAKELANANERDSMSMLDAVSLNAGADKVLAEEAWKAAKAVEDAKARARQAAGGEAKMLELISATVQGGDKVRGLAAEVERKQNRSIFDLVSDPIGTIKDIVTLDNSKEALQGAVQTTSATALAATQRHTALQHGFKESEDLKNTVTAATLQAANDKIDAIRMENSAKARIQGRMYNLDGVKTALAMSVQEAQSYSQIFGTTQAVQQQQNQMEQLQISRNNSATSQAHLELAKKQFQEQLKVRQEASDEIAVVSGAIRNGMAAAGVQVPGEAALRLHAKEAISDKNSPFYQYYAIGLRNSALGPNAAVLGATPGEAYDILSRRDLPIAVPDVVKPVLGILKDAASLVKGVDKKSQPEAWNKAYGEQVKSLMGAESINITSASFLDVGKSLDGYISGSPALTALPITTKFLAPMIQAGQSIADPVVTLKLGTEAVAKGVLTSDELIGGMSAIYRQAAITHAQALRLKDFGIITPYAAGAEYNVKMGFSDKINLTSSTELSKWVARNLAGNIDSRRLIYSPYISQTARELKSNGQ